MEPLAVKATASLTLPPPAMFPTEHETVMTDCGSVDGVQLLLPAPLVAETVMPVTVTALGNVTLMTVCVAVAPPEPDPLKNFVTETALPPDEKCGAVRSVTQLDSDRFVPVPTVGTAQMFPLAARLLPAQARTAATEIATTRTTTPPNLNERFRIETFLSPGSPTGRHK
jgi:hypothetical protein